MALKLAISASILTAVSVPMLAQAKVTAETVQIVPKVDERDLQIVRLHARLQLVTHRWKVRGKVIHRLRSRLRERENSGARGAAASRRTWPSRSLSGWSSAQATWYGPGFYGHSPACAGNGVLTESSWWVATVPSSCGTPYTICDTQNGKCVHVTAQDTGGFTPGDFDMTPAVARALGGLYTHSVRYRRG